MCQETFGARHLGDRRGFFGDLEHDARRLDASREQMLAEEVQQSGVPKRAPGEVHCGDAGPAVFGCARGRDHAAQHPLVDLHDLAGVLGGFNEALGRMRLVAGIAQPHQRLE